MKNIMMKTRYKVVISILCILFALLGAQGGWALEIGEEVPEFSLSQMGKDGTLSPQNLKGKVIYVDFWASWCGPCRISFPGLSALREELHDKGFEIYAINLDENTKDAKKFLEEFKVSYPILQGYNTGVPELFDLMGMPTAYLVDQKGIVQWKHSGFKEKDLSKIKKKILEMISSES